MGNPAIDRDAHYTYRHYRTWPDEERWELIDGQAWVMSPAPVSNHQRVVGSLSFLFLSYVRGKPFEAFIAPFDVMIPRGDEPDDEVDSIVQPDLCVYRDRSRVTRRGGSGAPDLVVEVLSPRTSKKDQNDKFRLYERSGVLEYWVVDIGNRSVCVYRPLQNPGEPPCFDEGELREPDYDFSPLASVVLEGFSIEPAALFENVV
ncbi:MAG: Uma2 family endonuclease [Spirochaetota bacterium]